MAQHVLLNNLDHQDLRLITRPGSSVGDGVNQVLIYPNEYSDIQRHYPIFFRKAETGGFKSIALLGFDKDENLFLGDDGWNATYIPATQKIGPFLIGQPKPAPGEDLPADAAAMIMIDTNHVRISRSEGEPLFLSHGGYSPALVHVTEILQQVYAGSEISDSMFAAFFDTGLLAPIEVNVQLDDKTSYILKDLFTVSREAFQNLAGDQLKALNDAGFLALAVFVMSSMSNLGHLINLKNDRRSA